ncbi:MAG: AAA family ATPase [Ardenticatenales bacterium]|nr:AAA family ATPase [Ardenticatenales bacterium]
MTNVQLACPNCGFDDNPTSAHFCGQCAAKLPFPCPQCGAINPPGFRFCSQCAAALAGSTPLRTTRRLVTVLFADVCNSTALTAAIGAERMYGLLDDLLRRMSEAVRRFEGTIDKIMGDGLMAVFGMPTALEQHAVQSTYAALAMLEELTHFNTEFADTLGQNLQLRIGLASGEVVAGGLGSERSRDITVIGDVPNLAARLQQNAAPGTILIDNQAARYVAPLFDLVPVTPLTLKGFDQPVPAFLLRGKRDQPGLLRGLSGQRTPLVGRQMELDHLEQAVHNLHQQRGGVICLFGEAGIGKSRITNELLERVKGAGVRVLEGDCFSHTRNLPYSAFNGVIRDFCGVLPTDSRTVVQSKIRTAIQRANLPSKAEIVPYLEYLLSIDLVDETLLEQVRHLDPGQLKRNVFLAVRELLLGEAQRRPTILVLDDLQWVDEISTELIGFLTQSIKEAPLLLYLIARDDEQPHLRHTIEQLLAGVNGRGTRLTLRPLSTEELRQMALALMPQAGPALLDRLVHHAEGVPFYLEELVRHTLSTSTEMQLPLGSPLVSIPSSLEALIRARYDQLPEPLQLTLAKAAVIGRRFALPLLRVIDGSHRLETHLEQLHERAFIRPRRTSSEEWTFMHLITQETIYQSLLHQQRRALHTDVGEALERMARNRLDEHVETLAFHFSHSNDTLKAIPYLLQAAQRAAGRFANEEALRLYAEADQLLGEENVRYLSERVTLETGRADVLALLGRYEEARAAYQSALHAIRRLPTMELAIHASVERRIAGTYEKQTQYEEASQHLTKARHILADSDQAERSRINSDMGWVAFSRGELDEAKQYLQAALQGAEVLRNRSLQAQVYNRLAGLNFRHGALKEAQAMVELSLEMSRRLDDQIAVARALTNLGILVSSYSDWAAAENYHTESQAIFTRNGDIEGQSRTTMNTAVARLMRGHLEEAMQTLEEGYQLAKRVGSHNLMGVARMNQGRVAFFQGRLLMARRYLIEAASIYRPMQAHKGDRADSTELLGRIALLRHKPVMLTLLARKAVRLATDSVDAHAGFRARRLLALTSTRAKRFDEAEQLFEALHRSAIASDPYESALLFLVQALHDEERGLLAEAAQSRAQAQALFEENAIPLPLRTFLVQPSDPDSDDEDV